MAYFPGEARKSAVRGAVKRIELPYPMQFMRAGLAGSRLAQTKQEVNHNGKS